MGNQQSRIDWLAAFIEYADHTARCESRHDPHTRHNALDDRAVCTSYPCTCNLVTALEAATGQLLTVPDPDKQVTRPVFTLISTTASSSNEQRP